MRPLALLHLPGDSHESDITARPIRIAVADVEQGGLLISQAAQERRIFTSVHEDVLAFELATTPLGGPRLTPDNPFLSAEQKARQAEDGLIRAGAIVRTGDVLASIVMEPPAASRQPAKDYSETVPAAWDGATVVWARLRDPREPGKRSSKGLLQIQVALRAERDLKMGDVLVCGQSVLGVVSGVSGEAPNGADLIVPASVGHRLGMKPGDCQSFDVGKGDGGDVLAARSTGAYSIITCMPLAGGDSPIQNVGLAQVRWLRSRGLNACLAELVSLKSDGLRNRRRLLQVLKNGGRPEEMPQPGTPETLATLRAMLMGLGLHVELTGHEDHVDLAIYPASSEQIMSWSSGEIRKPETIHYRTYKPMIGGLFCPQVFGPEELPRRRRFAHVPLPTPVVPILWRTGSFLERLLGLAAADIERVVHYEAGISLDGDQVKLTEVEAGSLGGGGQAIRALLQRVPAERLPPGLRGRADLLTPTVVPMVPADLRPLVLLDSGNFATSDLNDLYRRLINRRNRLVKLEELKAPRVIILNERRMLQENVDQLLGNCLLPPKEAALGSANRPLMDVLAMATGQLEDDTKRVDWAGRARAVASSALPADQALVPRLIFDTLRLQADVPVLITEQDSASGAFAALLPRSHDAGLIQLPAGAYERLGLQEHQAPICIVHRPLGGSAIAEARRLLQADPGPTVAVTENAGWIDAASQEEMIAGLIEAALSGQTVHLTSPRGLLLAGTGPVELGTDADLVISDTGEFPAIA